MPLYRIYPSHWAPFKIPNLGILDMPTYIQETALPTIPEDDAEDLEDPIQSTECLQVIKDLENGKSPGPDGPPFLQLL